MINKYLLILGTAHVLGDFYLQTEKIAKQKEEKYVGVLWHCLEYYFASLLVILPILSVDLVLAMTYMGVSHFAIDTIKYILLRKKKVKTTCKVFVIDQLLHIVCIGALAYIMILFEFNIGKWEIVNHILITLNCDAEIILRWVLAILLIHIPTNIFIQKFIGDYKPKENEQLITVEKKAGRRIGTIERLIMLIFFEMNQYSAIGFVLTAKSVARYDKIAKDEKFAEYYLLGTLTSTLCVIVCGIVVVGW